MQIELAFDERSGFLIGAGKLRHSDWAVHVSAVGARAKAVDSTGAGRSGTDLQR